ncbi:hypothetical protein GCK32_010681 [Trichostrongylus colubriformis]|uniref:Uncharacterized protein n=1 Tax=Trichostrongylus colubriformis TaxID=6319 RepID=A0AAN8GD47_TRICO
MHCLDQIITAQPLSYDTITQCVTIMKTAFIVLLTAYAILRVLGDDDSNSRSRSMETHSMESNERPRQVFRRHASGTASLLLGKQTTKQNTSEALGKKDAAVGGRRLVLFP